MLVGLGQYSNWKRKATTMTDTTARNRGDAIACIESREADAAGFWHRIDMHNDADAEAATDEMNEYPLSLEWGNGRVRLIFGTGGPHDELSWVQTEDYGEPTDLTYVFLPWFDRVELSPGPALQRWAEDVASCVTIAGLPGYDEDWQDEYDDETTEEDN